MKRDTVTVDFERFAELIEERARDKAKLSDQRAEISVMEMQIKQATAKANTQRPETEQFTELKLSAVIARLSARSEELDTTVDGNHELLDAEAKGIEFALRTIKEFTGAK